MVKVLLEAGADIEARNSKGATALMVAAINRHDDIFLLLLGAGADSNAKCYVGRTFHMHVALQGDAKLVQPLLQVQI